MVNEGYPVKLSPAAAIKGGKLCLYLTYIYMTQQLKFKIWGMALAALFFAGCKKQYPVNIPYVKFDMTINVLDPTYVSLQGVGGSIKINGGSRGILVYRVSIDQFNAYERQCTYDTDNPCGKVDYDSSGILLVDNDCSGAGCGSKFNMIDGSVVNGPAQYPLIQYTTQFDGVAMLRIYNN